MKMMIRGFLAMAVLCSVNAVSAQQGGKRTPEERAHMQVQWMEKNLAITDAQDRKAYDIILRYAKQTDDLRNAPGGGNGEKRQQMEGINAGRDAELKAVLTGDQYTRYQAHVQEMRENMQRRRGGD